MNILAGSYYEIGSTHTVCEDYARTGKFIANGKEYSYAVISDGCSSSNDTDIGARLLSLQVPNSLEYAYTDSSVILTIHDKFLEHMSISLQNISKMFPDMIQNLYDATLMVAVSDGNFTDIYVYGDGTILYNTISREEWCKEKISSINLEYEMNAPYYISYKSLSPSRNKDYIKQFGHQHKICTQELFGDKSPTTFKMPFDEPSCFRICNKIFSGGLQSVSICSDGIDTFKKGFDKLPLLDVYKEFTNYKNIKGDFVSRRMLAYKRKCIRENIKHEDDISIATLYFDYEEQE